MKIQEAKENVMKNFRANYTADHMDLHDIEVFLLNTLEQIESVVMLECDTDTMKAVRALSKIASQTHLTPEIEQTATLYLQGLEQERGAKYVRSLQETIEYLKLEGGVKQALAERQRVIGIIEQYNKHSSHNAGDNCLEEIIKEINI